MFSAKGGGCHGFNYVNTFNILIKNEYKDIMNEKPKPTEILNQTRLIVGLVRNVIIKNYNYLY